MDPSQRSVMIFDGDCGFCRRWIARWKHATGDRVEYVPYQEAGPRFPQIAAERFAQAVHLVEPDGRVSFAAEAAFRALGSAPGGGWLLFLYRYLPLFAPISETLYRWVANHRDFADRVTTLLWGHQVVPPGETRTVRLFLRCMGAVYAVAFLSLWVQVDGLIGVHGILPAKQYLAAASSQLGAIRYWALPTLCWFGSGDLALHLICAGGVLCAALAIFGLLPAPALIGAWIGYLSLATVGQDFLHFQWDSLLLEAGFVAILLAPWQIRLRGGERAHPHSHAALWLGRWLLFRLMFASAVVKLASGDPTWHSLTALDYHYFTQPLPPWTAWYFNLLPQWFEKLSVLFMFAVEGLAPFLIFGPRRLRFTAAGAIASLQLLILITGNYGFFNLLALSLCVLLLDDGFLSGIWHGVRRGPIPSGAEPAVRSRPKGGTGPARRHPWPRRIVVLALFLLSLVPMTRALQLPTGWLGPIKEVYRWSSPLQLVNSYGLFAVMTTERPEILVEGSRDGEHWKPYEFRYKPGALDRRPRFVIAHMPRLDWQMWFAALGDYRQNRWFLAFCQRLLQGSTDVTALLAEDPFAGDPPRYLRARVFLYRFTTPAQRRQDHAWWTRTLRGPYVPTLTLVDDKLEAVSQSPSP